MTVQTRPGLDGALSWLLAHVASTEYSVAEIKRDLKLNTPSKPPYSEADAVQDGMNMIGGMLGM